VVGRVASVFNHAAKTYQFVHGLLHGGVQALALNICPHSAFELLNKLHEARRRPLRSREFLANCISQVTTKYAGISGA
jgi:hypothetical protein